MIRLSSFIRGGTSGHHLDSIDYSQYHFPIPKCVQWLEGAHQCILHYHNAASFDFCPSMINIAFGRTRSDDCSIQALIDESRLPNIPRPKKAESLGHVYLKLFEWKKELNCFSVIWCNTVSAKMLQKTILWKWIILQDRKRESPQNHFLPTSTNLPSRPIFSNSNPA